MTVLESLHRFVTDPLDSSAVRSAAAVEEMLAKEYVGLSNFSVPPQRRLEMWRHGFRSQAAVMYDFDTHEISAYLSDFQRELTAWINGEWAVALDNKVIFHWMLNDYKQYRPRIHGLFDNGRFRPINSRRVEIEQPVHAGTNVFDVEENSRRASAPAAEWVCNRLTSEERLVIKPVSSGGGNDVHVLSFSAGEYFINDNRCSETKFRRFLSKLKNTLVMEYVSQAQYASDLFADTTNTIRVLTMWDEQRETPFIPTAVHRIGTNRSVPVDNWSRGGLSALINVETGTLGPGIQYPYSGTLVEHTTHPDSENPIQGTTVPGWNTIREELLNVAKTYSHIPYIGWDIVVTEEGFTILEANNCTDVDLLQVHQPLLADSRTRRFYEHHGIL